MSGPAPGEYGWWLASRAAGVTALVCITVAVVLGLALGGRVARRPGWPRVLLAVHEHAALAGLVAVAVHGVTLLGDGWLKAGIADIAVPFASGHEPLWTGLGVVGGWLAALLGLTFYARRRIGVQRWRKLHRATILVYVLAVAHTLGSGTDAGEPWMQLLLLGTGAPVLFLFVMRVLPRPVPPAKDAAPRPARPARGHGAPVGEPAVSARRSG
jgi:sulfoxide reductase heme-binding subunit YedZ